MGQNVIMYVSNAYHTVYPLRKSLIQLVCDLTGEVPDLEVCRKKRYSLKRTSISAPWPCVSQNCLLAYGSTTA